MSVGEHQMIEITGSLRVDARVRDWCKFPYPGHPKGCPNHGRAMCPPGAPMIDDFYDLTRPHWFAVVPFDLGSHVAWMLRVHPRWSERQARCCLYWQGGVRAELEAVVKLMQWQHPGTTGTLCPEAMGVNVFRTLHVHDVPIRKNPHDTVYKVAMVGYPSNGI